MNALAPLGIPLDDDVAHKIITRCQNTNKTASVEDVAVFATLTEQQLAKRRNIEN